LGEPTAEAVGGAEAGTRAVEAPTPSEAQGAFATVLEISLELLEFRIGFSEPVVESELVELDRIQAVDPAVEVIA